MNNDNESMGEYLVRLIGESSCDVAGWICSHAWIDIPTDCQEEIELIAQAIGDVVYRRMTTEGGDGE